MFCCDCGPVEAAAAETCPSAKQHKADDGTPSASHRAEADCVGLCSVLPAVLDKARKVDTVDRQIEPARVVAAVALLPALSVARESTPIFTRSRIPDRHGTYLANRSIRI